MTPADNSYLQIVEKHAALSAMLAKIADEDRKPTDAEKSELSKLRSDIDAIKSAWEAEGRKRFLDSLQKSESSNNKLVLKASDSFADLAKGSYDPDHERASISRYLRGYITGDWGNAPLELKTMASSAAGAILPTPISARVIDLARNASTVFRAGAVTVPMTAATLKLARLTGDVTAGWYSEAGAISESDATLDSVTFTARKMGVLVRVNNELLEDSAPGVDSIIENSIAQAVALELDRVALIGSGTPPEPKGLKNVSGINTVASVGTPTSYDKWLDAIYEVRLDNYEPNAVINAVRTAKTLAQLKTGLTSDKTPLVAPADYAALSKFATNQLPVNLGAGTNESISVVGKFDELMIGLRSNMSIEVSREANDVFAKDQTLIRCTWRGDVQVSRATAFCLMSGILA